jgi:raffinose/stachyose/melibiose transport system substrate-binding protein
MNKMRMLMLVLTIMIAISLNACSQKTVTEKATDKPAASGNTTTNTPAATSAPKDPVEIQWYLHNQDDPELIKLMRDIVDNFQKKNPSIRVKMIYNADPDGQIKTQLAAGQGPDIIGTDGPTTLKQYAAAGYLLPLDKYSQTFGWEKRFDTWAFNAVKTNEGLMGLPGSYESLVLYYNKDMFKENGWELPKNYGDLMALSAKIQAKNIIPIAFGTTDFKAANEWWLSVAYNATLGREEFKKVLTGEQPWNSSLMQEATQKYVDLWQKGYINSKQSGAIKVDDATTLFESKKAAMKLEGTWLVSNLIADKPAFNWGVVAMPSWKDGVPSALPLALGDAIGINKKSKHPDEVATFLDYMNSTEVIQLLVPRGQFHPLKDFDANAIPNVDSHVKDAYAIITEATTNNTTGYASWTYWPPSVETYAWDNIESVLYGKLDVKSYLDKAVVEFDKDKAANKLFDFRN